MKTAIYEREVCIFTLTITLKIVCNCILSLRPVHTYGRSHLPKDLTRDSRALSNALLSALCATYAGTDDDLS